MQNYSKVGGVLSIVAGAFGVLWLVMIICGALFTWVIFSDPYAFDEFNGPPEGFFAMMVAIYIVMGLFYALIGVLAIVGGAFALKKKYWGWSLAGAIAGTITFFPCGIPALIFIAMAKPEFNVTPPPTAVQT